MTLLISVGFLLMLLTVVLWKSYAADKSAKRMAKEQAERRRLREEELMAKVHKIRNRSDTDRAKAAIDRDPERAARVVGKMMKK